MMYFWSAFLLFSAVLVYISRASLRAPGSHGFYRFWAWECILALILLNLPVWFRAPFSWNQIVSWILLVASLVPLWFGVRSLTSQGKPVARRADDANLFGFEKTSALVTTGIYRYIRHPLYSSLLLLAWGTFFKSPGGLGFALAAAATLFLTATAKADEAECLRFFGEEYRAYMKTTKRFLPFLF